MDRNYEYKKEVKSVRWLLFGVILSLFAAEVLFEAVVSFMSVPPHKYLRMAVVEIAPFLLPMLLLKSSSLKKYNNIKSLRLNNISKGQLALVILLGMGGQFVMMLLNLPLQYIFKVFFHIGEASPELGAVSFWTVIGGVVSVCILPAFLEEFWMRGLVFEVYNRVSTKNAVLFTTFIFAVFHGRPEEIIGYIFMGLMTIFVMLRCNSLYAAILYHFVSNLTALIFSILIMDLVNYLWLIIFLMVMMFFAVLIVFYKKYSAVGTVRGKKGVKIFKSSIISLPVILSICIVVLKYILLNT